MATKWDDVTMEDATTGPLARETPKQKSYTMYAAVAEITYAPENALEEGVGMVNAIKNSLKKLNLGSKLRQDVWSREIERRVLSLSNLRIDNDTLPLYYSLKSQGAPTTLIAVCGGM